MKLLPLFILIVLMFSCNKRKNITSLKKDNLKGKVSIVTEYTYYALEKFGEPQKDGRISKSISKYNINGNLTEENWYDSDESINSKRTLEYNENGYLIEEQEIKHGKLSIMKYENDELGNAKELNIYDAQGNFEGKNIFKYDDKWNNDEVINYYSDGRLSARDTYKYDDNGCVLENKHYGSDNKLFITFEYKYDTNMNEIQLNKYQSEGLQFEKDDYKYMNYDKIGNWIQSIGYYNDKLMFIMERQIDYY